MCDKSPFIQLSPLSAEELAVLDGNWELGDGVNAGSAPPFLYFILERFYTELGARYELSCAKSIINSTDPMAREWHNDADNPDDHNTKFTILIYRSTSVVCPLEVLERDGTIHQVHTFPGLVIALDNTQKSVLHRCRPGDEFRSFVKVTLK